MIYLQKISNTLKRMCSDDEIFEKQPSNNH